MALHEFDVARLAALADALEADKAALAGHGIIVPDDTKHDDIADLIRQIRMLRVETGTLTPAEDTQSISIDCTPNAALVTLESADVLADTTKALYIICCVAVNSRYIMDADVFNLTPQVNAYTGQGGIANTIIDSSSFTDGFSAASTSPIKFAAGCAYRWVAYYFDAIGGGAV